MLFIHHILIIAVVAVTVPQDAELVILAQHILYSAGSVGLLIENLDIRRGIELFRELRKGGGYVARARNGYGKMLLSRRSVTKDIFDIVYLLQCLFSIHDEQLAVRCKRHSLYTALEQNNAETVLELLYRARERRRTDYQLLSSLVYRMLLGYDECVFHMKQIHSRCLLFYL